jgi:hypothetical protein
MITKGEFNPKEWEEAESAAMKKKEETKNIAFMNCYAINPGHPELVAQNIKDMYEALKIAVKYQFYLKNVEFKELDKIKAVLSKISGGK